MACADVDFSTFVLLPGAENPMIGMMMADYGGQTTVVSKESIDKARGSTPKLNAAASEFVSSMAGETEVDHEEGDYFDQQEQFDAHNFGSSTSSYDQDWSASSDDANSYLANSRSPSPPAGSFSVDAPVFFPSGPSQSPHNHLQQPHNRTRLQKVSPTSSTSSSFSNHDTSPQNYAFSAFSSSVTLLPFSSTSSSSSPSFFPHSSFPSASPRSTSSSFSSFPSGPAASFEGDSGQNFGHFGDAQKTRALPRVSSGYRRDTRVPTRNIILPANHSQPFSGSSAVRGSF